MASDDHKSHGKHGGKGHEDDEASGGQTSAPGASQKDGHHKESHHREGPSVTDTIRKIVTTGISAAFMTEESIRGFVSEMKLPKETLNLLLQGASKSKEELMNRVSREVINIISKIDVVKEASRFVEEHKFRINAEIEVIRKEPSASRDHARDSHKEASDDEGSLEVKIHNASAGAPSGASGGPKKP